MIQMHTRTESIAHPFSIGSPICTGCRWEFQVKDYDNVDFIELWNRVNPDESFRSRLAYEMWTDLLKKGHRISCSAGRDWRRIESEMDNTALTYIGLQELTEDGVKESLENGNFYITLGPRLQMQIEQNGRIHHLGQELQSWRRAAARQSGIDFAGEIAELRFQRRTARRHPK